MDLDEQKYRALVKRRQRGREERGVIKSEKWADVVYGWPPRTSSVLAMVEQMARL